MTSKSLICSEHNRFCGTWADSKLADEYAFTVNALEVLKGDGLRGTTVLNLSTQDDTLYDLLPDFRFRLVKTVEKLEDRIEISRQKAMMYQKIERQIKEFSDLTDVRTEIRRCDFISHVNATGISLHGVLKTALHFLALIARERKLVRELCHNLAPQLFSDGNLTNVGAAYYDATDNGSQILQHEIVAWNEDEQTLVRIRLFSMVTLIVWLPFIKISPTRFIQHLQSGKYLVEQIDIPIFTVFESMHSQAGHSAGFARRVDAIIAIGSYKSDLVEIFDDAVTSFNFRSAIGSSARRRVLEDAIALNFKLRDGDLFSYMSKELVAFQGREISQLSK